MTLSLTVLVSGTGSNLGAILAAIDAGTCDACVRAVISDRSQAKGLSLATERNIATAVIKLADYPSRPAWDDALTATVQNFDPDVVVLAGFMKIIGAPMVAAFAGGILNVHPSLLPAFPGTEAPARALAAYRRMKHPVAESPSVMALFDSALAHVPRADSLRYDSFDGVLSAEDDRWRYGFLPDERFALERR